VGVSDPSLVEHVAFADVEVGDCIADTEAVDGLVALASCEVEGALPVREVTTVGEGAPESRPAHLVVHGYATAACEDAATAYAQERGVPETGLLRVAVISDSEWFGEQTPVVCAILEVL